MAVNTNVGNGEEQQTYHLKLTAFLKKPISARNFDSKTCHRYFYRSLYYKTHNYIFLIITCLSQYQNSYSIFISAINLLKCYLIKCNCIHRWNSLLSFDLYLQKTIYPNQPLAIGVGDGSIVRHFKCQTESSPTGIYIIRPLTLAIFEWQSCYYHSPCISLLPLSTATYSG